MSAIDTNVTNSLDCYCEERQAFADLAKDIATKKLVEKREEHDKYPFSELFDEAIKDAGTVGFYGVNLPDTYGGVGMGTGMVAAIIEKLSETDASLAGIVFTNAAALEILKAASEAAQDSSVYQRIKSIGTVPVAYTSFSSHEDIELPIADASHSSITGKIDYLVLGSIADYAVIPARHLDAHKFSYYLIDLKSDKIKKSKPIVSLGLHACPAIDITMNNVPAALIGTSGDGGNYFVKMLNSMSVCATAMSLGIMKGSLNDSLQYTADRYQVRMMLANMAIEMKIGETCLRMACSEMEANISGWEKTAQAAAIHTGELANRCATDGVQLFGGNGYTKDYPQEKRMRDAKQAQCLLGLMPLRKINFIASIIAENE
jgi:alkylation response protein AidB-like acyl-CoA dehydrogenase